MNAGASTSENAEGGQMPNRQLSEQAIQKALVQHLRTRAAPDVFWFHVPNGGYRRPIEAAILRGLGVKAGVPDLCFVHNSKFYCLELKAEKGRPTEAQLAALAALDKAGAFTALAHGLDRAVAVLEQWGILRGRSG